MKKNEINTVFVLKTGDGKILPSVRGLWRRSFVEWGQRPSDPGKKQSTIPASVSPNLDLFREGPSNPIHGTHWHSGNSYFHMSSAVRSLFRYEAEI
jgi:hypothetical protein